MFEKNLFAMDAIKIMNPETKEIFDLEEFKGQITLDDISQGNITPEPVTYRIDIPLKEVDAWKFRLLGSDTTVEEMFN